MGGTYEFAKTASANLREQQDSWNNAVGGFFSGAILGLRGQSQAHKEDRKAIGLDWWILTHV